MTRPAVRIAYCADCGYDSQAIDLVRALLSEFGHDLSSIAIIPWDDGTFDVSVDGEVVHSMVKDGGFPDPSAVKDRIRARVALAEPRGD
jgi:selenoprotein W-related protein